MSVEFRVDEENGVFRIWTRARGDLVWSIMSIHYSVEEAGEAITEELNHRLEK